MLKPVFSLIIPTLNEAQYLPHLLQDLVNQSYQDFEVIIVDAKSSDNTLSKVRAFNNLLNLKILTSQIRHVCTQRNLGAKSASSDVLIFCDADNRLPPYFLQGVKYRLESSDADLLSFWLQPDVKNSQNDTIALAINTFLEFQSTLKPTYLLESLFAVHKHVFEKIGGFDESIHYAEGKSLIQSLIQLGYTSKIYKDPTYTFSFRRFRKYGVLSIVARLAKLELAELFGPDFHSLQAKKLYPMQGGSFFHKTTKAKNKFLKNIQKLLKDL